VRRRERVADGAASVDHRGRAERATPVVVGEEERERRVVLEIGLAADDRATGLCELLPNHVLVDAELERAAGWDEAAQREEEEGRTAHPSESVTELTEL
jgi:hypothetical protein